MGLLNVDGVDRLAVLEDDEGNAHAGIGCA